MTDETELPRCEICGEPMPEGETMFKFHGFSGPCPAPPLPRPAAINWQTSYERALARLATLDAQLESAKRDAEMWQDRAERCGVAMALFASAIKSGEPWSDECQRALDAARKEK